MLSGFARSVLVLAFLVLILHPVAAEANHILGVRITQTGNTGLMVDIDVTAFYTTTTMFPSSYAYLGTTYNMNPDVAWGDGAFETIYGTTTSTTGIPFASTTTVNGVPARAYRGSFSHTYASPGSYTITANTDCCPGGSPTYTAATGTVVYTTFTTTTTGSPTPFTTTQTFVRNTLAVTAVAPSFSKVFAPAAVGTGATSTLTFTIDNTASTLDDNALDFTDNLPAGLTVASPANAATTCTGGTLNAASATAVISYTGGSVAAGATCTISVDIATSMAGDFLNTTGDLTSAFGNSGTASDTLSVNDAPLFTKAFSPIAIEEGEVSTLTFTIDNTASALDATGLDFTDNLPAGMTVATPANAVNTCTGGILTAVDGSAVISYTGGTVSAGAACTISVDVTIMGGGPFDNVAGALTSSQGSSGAGSATASLGVNVVIPTLSTVGLALLTGLLAFLAFFTLRRKQTRSSH